MLPFRQLPLPIPKDFRHSFRSHSANISDIIRQPPRQRPVILSHAALSAITPSILNYY